MSQAAELTQTGILFKVLPLVHFDAHSAFDGKRWQSAVHCTQRLENNSFAFAGLLFFSSTGPSA